MRYFTQKLDLVSNILSMAVALMHKMRKSKTSNPHTGLYNPAILEVIHLWPPQSEKFWPPLLSHLQPSSHGLCCTTMNVHNWIQTNRKMLFPNIPHKLQQWNQYTYLYTAFFFTKAHIVYISKYKFHKYNKTDRKANIR